MAYQVDAARIHAPDEISLDSLTVPAAGSDDIVVRVHSCGICGSDLSYSKLGGLPGAAKPFAFGHEFSGVVAEAGANVSHVKTGDRVVVNPEGAGNRIGSGGVKGAFASHVLVENVAAEPGAVLPLPEAIDFELAALIEPLSVGMHGVDRAGITAEDRVLVMGAGPVGLSTALAARYQGAKHVVVADLSAKRLEIAASLGLSTFHAGESADDLDAFLRSEHGAVHMDPLLGEQAATDVFFEATGVGEVFGQILGMARKQARVVIIGVHFAPFELDMINLLLRELSITASQAYDNSVFARVIEMLQSGAVDPRPMVTHRFPLSDFNRAFAQARRPEEAVKVMVDCQA